MDIARKIAQATGAWLQYEFACGRSELFSEKYMAVPIGDVLHTIFREDVCAEYPHPILAPVMNGPGRRPEVDFVVAQDFNKPSVAIETKWVCKNAVSNTPIIRDILWDVIRLSLMVHHLDTQAFLVVAGKKKELDKVFSSKRFLGSKRTPILKTNALQKGNYKIDNPYGCHLPLLKKLLKPYSNLNFPIKISANLPSVFPENTSNFQYQAYVWEIKAVEKKEFFKPNNCKCYT